MQALYQLISKPQLDSLQCKVEAEDHMCSGRWLHFRGVVGQDSALHLAMERVRESGETEKCLDVGDVAETEPKSMHMRTREETRRIQI